MNQSGFMKSTQNSWKSRILNILRTTIFNSPKSPPPLPDSIEKILNMKKFEDIICLNFVLSMDLTFMEGNEKYHDVAKESIQYV